jgi:two-component system, cell cycle sensor histidine kinase and response regulator CckA
VEADHRFRSDLEEIERAGVRAASLTQQLLAFSRRQVLRPQALDLNGVVRDMERLLRRLIGSHIRLEVDLEAGLPTIQADRGQVEQVLMNLAVNARDAMPDGGALSIRTDTEQLLARDPRLHQWDMPAGRYARLVVEDTGAGMPQHVLARAFDPFFTTKERGKATGLGLATVFGIVKQSGGHVAAESEPGQGSRFTVFLPAAAELPEPDTAAPGSGDNGSQACTKPGATILVVEDEAPVRNLAVRVLERHGYAVMAAGDGVEALALAAAHPGDIHLVVSDLVMPEMGGRELARRIRSVRPSTRILLMSGYDAEMVTGNVDADDFLPKPFTPADLADRVAAILARQP